MAREQTTIRLPEELLEQLKQEADAKTRIKKTSVELTDEEWSDLVTYLYMTEDRRKGELEACKSLAKEKDEQGNIKYPNMERNARFWDEMNTTIEDIIKAIENRKML